VRLSSITLFAFEFLFVHLNRVRPFRGARIVGGYSAVTAPKRRA
jgi:hypothetical protein